MREYHAGHDTDEGLVTTNCSMCGQDTGNELDMLCEDCYTHNHKEHRKMIGYITIDPQASPKAKAGAIQVRAHCRATTLSECNRTLLWNVWPCDIRTTLKQAETKLFAAGCAEIETNDLRMDS